MSERRAGDWARIENKVRATRAEQGLPPKVEDHTTLHAIATPMRPGLAGNTDAIRGPGGRKAA